jgi:hypothetical protein
MYLLQQLGGTAGKAQSLSSTDSSFSAEWNTVTSDCECPRCKLQSKERPPERAAVGQNSRSKRDAEDAGQERNCYNTIEH